MKLLLVCLVLAYICEATSLIKRKSISHQENLGRTSSDPSDTTTTPARLRLTDAELQNIVDTPPKPLTPDEQRSKDAYDAEINEFVSTLTMLANFYGVFIPDQTINEREAAQKKAVLDQIKNSALDLAHLSFDNEADMSRSQVWDAETTLAKTKNAWYKQYYNQVNEAKQAAPHRSGTSVDSTHGDWTFSLNWVGSTDPTHDSSQEEDKALLAKASADLAQKLGEIPPTDPLSTTVLHALSQHTAPSWQDIFDKINEVRTKEERAEADAALHANAQPQTDTPASGT